ncbi:MAG: tetratricopeptide repeat protein, partial [Solirubrobacterales bacterium]
MMGVRNRLFLAVCGMFLCVCGAEAPGQSVGDMSSDATRFDSRAIVVLGYLEHHQGLIAGVRWPKVAFAVGDGTLLLTAAHCVDDFQEPAAQAVSTDIVVISPYYGDVFRFDVVAIDKEADVAILRAPWRSHPALALATEEELAAAKKILIAGRPQTVRRVSPDLQTELLSVSRIDESVPSEAVSLTGTRLVAKGWSGSAMLVAETGNVAGVLTKLRQQMSRWAWFSYVSQSEVLGCSIRSVYSLLREHGLEAAALGRPVNLEAVADSERGFLLAIRYFQALFESDRARAVAAAEELTTLRPRSVQAHLLAAVGVSTVSMKKEVSGTLSEEQFNSAEASYAKALSIDPNNAQAHALYGNLLIVRGRTPEALAHSDAALAVDPNNRLALFNRMRLIPPAQRKDIAERLVAVDPRNPLHWYYYSEALLMLGEKDDALRAAQKAAGH